MRSRTRIKCRRNIYRNGAYHFSCSCYDEFGAELIMDLLLHERCDIFRVSRLHFFLFRLIFGSIQKSFRSAVAVFVE